MKNLATVISRSAPTDVFTFTGSPEKDTPTGTPSRASTPVTPSVAPLPNLPTTPLVTTPTTTPIIADRSQRKLLMMVGDIAKRQEVILKRLSAVELQQTTILSAVQTLLARQSDVQASASTQHSDLTDLSQVPSHYHIAEETLRGINARSFGPGNFAKRLTERMFPELFGIENLRTQYSYFGGGCHKKKELDPARKEVLRLYVCHFYPEVRSTDAWKDIVVPKINEGLRRPAEKKSKRAATKSTSAVNVLLSEEPCRSDTFEGRKCLHASVNIVTI